MRLTVFALAAFFACGSATAEGWRQYAYPEFSFSIGFPANPKVERTTYQIADGASVPSRVYSLEQDSKLYTVTVADFSRTDFDEKSAIEQAMRSLVQKGEIKGDILVLVDKVVGHQLSVSGDNGSRSSVALFFYQHRLYQAEGTVLPSNGDVMSGDGVRFLQSFRFTNKAPNSFAKDGAFGVTGRY